MRLKIYYMKSPITKTVQETYMCKIRYFRGLTFLLCSENCFRTPLASVTIMSCSSKSKGNCAWYAGSEASIDSTYPLDTEDYSEQFAIHMNDKFTYFKVNYVLPHLDLTLLGISYGLANTLQDRIRY